MPQPWGLYPGSTIIRGSTAAGCGLVATERFLFADIILKPGSTSRMILIFQFSRMVFLSWVTLLFPFPGHTPPNSRPLIHTFSKFLSNFPTKEKEKDVSHHSSSETTFKKKKEKII